MRNRRKPFYSDDTDYITNSPSYYDDLARKQKLIQLLAEKIWEYEETLDLTLQQIITRLESYIEENDTLMNERLEQWDLNIEKFPENVELLLQEWLSDGTLDHIINETIFNWKADKTYVDSEIERLDLKDEDLKTLIGRKSIDIFEFSHLATNKISDDPNTWDWTVAIQTAIDHVASSYEYNRLEFPAGKYKISDTVGFHSETAIDIGLHIVGSGRTGSTGRGTTIEQTNPEKDCLSFTSSVSNFRGLVIESIQLFGGVNGLNLQNNYYNYFRNVSFSRHREHCIKSSVGGLNVFESCYAVHVPANFCYFTGVGTNFFSNCVIGEDIGGIYLTTGTLRFSNCIFHEIRNKNDELGLHDLGNNVFGVDTGGRLFLDGCHITANSESDVLITISNQRDCKISNCNILLQGQTFLMSRYQHLTYEGSSFNVLNNNIEWESNAVLFENAAGTNESALRNSILDGNTFIIPESVTVESEDWFYNVISDLNNKIGINTVREV